MSLLSNESTVLDGYQLIRILGRGGFGEVWLCRSEAMGDYRALKIIPSTSASHLQKEYESLLHYRKASAALRSPHLLPIEHVNLIEQGLFYVMPLADGAGADDPSDANWQPITLASKIHERRHAEHWFSSGEIIEMMFPILQALQTLSDAGLIHRDVKPENILFFKGKPCLGDVSLLGQDAATITNRGTPGYSTPSWYLQGQPDMYGAAATLYHVLSGNLPDKMGRSSFLWPPHGEKSLDAKERAEWMRLHQVIRRACEEKPTERFVDFTSMAQALRASNTKDHWPGGSSSGNKPRKKSILLWISAAIVMLVMGKGIKVFFLKPTEETVTVTPPPAALSPPTPAAVTEKTESAKSSPRPIKIVDMRGYFPSNREKVLAILPFVLSSNSKTSRNLDFNATSERLSLVKAYESRDYDKCLALLEKRISAEESMGNSRAVILLKALILKHLGRDDEMKNLLEDIEISIPSMSTHQLSQEVTLLEALERFDYAEKLTSGAIQAALSSTDTSDKVTLYSMRARFRIILNHYEAALADEREALKLPPHKYNDSHLSEKEEYQTHLNTIVRKWEMLEQEFPAYADYLEANGSPEPMPDHRDYAAED
jgi:serine/threonine protein kinase